jgi:hypothetical protein
MEYIMPELLIGVLFLAVIGKLIKNAEVVDSRWIPLILGIIGVIFAPAYILIFGVIADVPQAIFTGIIQGALIAGAAVYGHQVVKGCVSDKHNKDF